MLNKFLKVNFSTKNINMAIDIQYEDNDEDFLFQFDWNEMARLAVNDGNNELAESIFSAAPANYPWDWDYIAGWQE